MLLTPNQNDEKSASIISPFSPDFISIFLTNEAERIQQNPNLAKTVVRDILHRKLIGKDGQFIELIDILISQNNYLEAFDLCRYSLSRSRKKGDIYAGLIESLIKLGIATVDTKSVLKIIAEYEYFETFRFCRAICHFFEDLVDGISNSDPKRNQYVQEGLKYSEKLKSLNPRNEQGYLFEIKLLNFIDMNAAKRKLQRIVMLARPQELARISMDSQETLLCPECCRLFVNNWCPQGDVALTIIERVSVKGAKDAKMLLLQELPPQEKIRLEELCVFFDKKLADISAYKIKLQELIKLKIKLKSFETEPVINTITTEPIDNLYKE